MNAGAGLLLTAGAGGVGVLLGHVINWWIDRGDGSADTDAMGGPVEEHALVCQNCRGEVKVEVRWTKYGGVSLSFECTRCARSSRAEPKAAIRGDHR